MRTTLDKLQPGDEAIVVEMHGEDETLNRLMELGLLEGTPLKLLRFAPLGDPLEILMRGYHLSLRRHEAAGILSILRRNLLFTSM
jgi:Fe2+ transport system protein FeoA